ncbi:hypothetical protein C8R47DRAFT_71109 [Mycena vitilis]|nr:hypothetical protein C8R47DRAFT_71109 [Mycena vitilis]
MAQPQMSLFALVKADIPELGEARTRNTSTPFRASQRSKLIDLVRTEIPTLGSGGEARTRSTSTPEMTRLLMEATIRRLEQDTTSTHTSRMDKWVQNVRLNAFTAKCLRGKWYVPETPSAASRRAIDVPQTSVASATADARAQRALAHELFTPQALDALAALEDNVHESKNLDSDKVLAILNASAVPVVERPTHTPPMESLLSQQAKDELDAIARGTRPAPEDSDAMLAILNAGNPVAAAVATEQDEVDDGASIVTSAGSTSVESDDADVANAAWYDTSDDDDTDSTQSTCPSLAWSLPALTRASSATSDDTSLPELEDPDVKTRVDLLRQILVLQGWL